MNKLTIDDISVKGKRVLVRVDFNVPLNEKQQVTDDTRIVESLPTIKKILKDGGRAVLMSHLGRPKGKPKPEFSLKPVAERLSKLLGKPVKCAPDCIGAAAAAYLLAWFVGASSDVAGLGATVGSLTATDGIRTVAVEAVLTFFLVTTVLGTAVAGRGGNAILPGRRIVYRKETPMCNLFLAMFARAKVKAVGFGDGTRPLAI